MTLVSRETLFAQAMNFGRSEGGRPSTSQMTDSGSVRAYRSTRSAGLPSMNSWPARASAMARMRGSMSRIARRRKASSTIPPQARMVRLVHGQHIVGERTDECRHPPSQPGKAAALLAQRERRAVLQHAGYRVVCRRDPDFADDGEAGLDDRSTRPQLFYAGGRVPEERLTGEINPYCHRSSSKRQAFANGSAARSCEPNSAGCCVSPSPGKQRSGCICRSRRNRAPRCKVYRGLPRAHSQRRSSHAAEVRNLRYPAAETG
jgi:hypothetical protein